MPRAVPRRFGANQRMIVLGPPVAANAAPMLATKKRTASTGKLVEKDAAKADTYRIRCEARYPEDGPGSVSVAVSWTATRQADPAAVKLEVVDEPTESQPGPEP